MEIFSEYLTFSVPDECQGCFVSFAIKKKVLAVFPGAATDIKTQAKSLPGMRGEQGMGGFTLGKWSSISPALEI